MTDSSTSALFVLHALPSRWQDKHVFTFVDHCFGDGARVFALLRLWREDPSRCERLHVVVTGGLSLLDAPSSENLKNIWPMRMPGVHRIDA